MHTHLRVASAVLVSVLAVVVVGLANAQSVRIVTTRVFANGSAPSTSSLALFAQLVYVGSFADMLAPTTAGWDTYARTYPQAMNASSPSALYAPLVLLRSPADFELGAATTTAASSLDAPPPASQASSASPDSSSVLPYRACRLSAQGRARAANCCIVVLPCPCGSASNCERTALLLEDAESAGARCVLIGTDAATAGSPILYLRRIQTARTPRIPTLRVERRLAAFSALLAVLNGSLVDTIAVTSTVSACPDPAGANATDLEAALVVADFRCDAARLLIVDACVASLVLLASCATLVIVVRRLRERRVPLRTSVLPLAGVCSGVAYGVSAVLQAALQGASCSLGCDWAALVAWSAMWLFSLTFYLVIGYAWALTLIATTSTQTAFSSSFFRVRNLRFVYTALQLALVATFFLRILVPYYGNDLVAASLMASIIFAASACVLATGLAFLLLLRRGLFADKNADKYRVTTLVLLGATACLVPWAAIQLAFSSGSLTRGQVCPLGCVRDVLQAFSVLVLHGFVLGFMRAVRTDSRRSSMQTTAPRGVDSAGNTVHDGGDGDGNRADGGDGSDGTTATATTRSTSGTRTSIGAATSLSPRASPAATRRDSALPNAPPSPMAARHAAVARPASATAAVAPAPPSPGARRLAGAPTTAPSASAVQSTDFYERGYRNNIFGGISGFGSNSSSDSGTINDLGNF